MSIHHLKVVFSGFILSQHGLLLFPPLLSVNSSSASAILSIIGNLLVIIMAVKKSSRMKPPELLCVNLAVTDLGAAVTMYPLAVASAWSHRWLGGDVTCISYGLLGFFFGVASIMNLTILAIVRFVVSLNLQSPSKKFRARTAKRMFKMCHHIWKWKVHAATSNPVKS